MAFYTFQPRMVCSRQIDIEVNDGIIGDVRFHGGCPGNLAAIPKLIKGMEAQKVVDLLKGNQCGNKGTSCADQLAKAVRLAYDKENNQ